MTCVFEGFGLTTLPGLLALLRTLPAILPMPPLAVCFRARVHRCISPYSLH
jgi:hypothetical protein